MWAKGDGASHGQPIYSDNYSEDSGWLDGLSRINSGDNDEDTADDESIPHSSADEGITKYDPDYLTAGVVDELFDKTN